MASIRVSVVATGIDTPASQRRPQCDRGADRRSGEKKLRDQTAPRPSETAQPTQPLYQQPVSAYGEEEYEPEPQLGLRPAAAGLCPASAPGFRAAARLCTAAAAVLPAATVAAAGARTSGRACAHAALRRPLSRSDVSQVYREPNTFIPPAPQEPVMRPVRMPQVEDLPAARSESSCASSAARCRWRTIPPRPSAAPCLSGWPRSD